MRGVPLKKRLSAKIAARIKALALATGKGLIRAYQLTLSPYLGHRCRFYPSCSQYAMAVLELHGPGKGAWLALRRLLKCHPFHPGGIDLPLAAKVDPP